MIFKTLSFIMMLMIFSMPFLSLAQETDDATQAVIDATADADKAQSLVWAVGGIGAGLLAGCILGPIVILGAYALPESPPAINLIGKSPEYVTIYTDTYETIMKKEQATQAAVGCLFGTAVSAVLLIFLTDNFESYR